MKILVAVANYGTKAVKYLAQVLAEYRAMPWEGKVVVMSNIPKDLGPDIEVVVGLPDPNPRSLPFGYKKIFAERANDFDLFIYTEDDVLITEQNVRSFLRATELLPEKYIAGFLRSEVSGDGRRFYSTIHGYYHWEPESVIRLGEFTFARYTNDHSGAFMLTKAQLARAIASGGFMRGFRQGRYGYLETAASDPYTQCGMTRLVAISHLRDFCLPHLANVYCGKIGVDMELVDREIAKLMSLNGAEPRKPLFTTETGLEYSTWDKQFYEFARVDVLSLVPPDAKRVLSVGCGWGETEGMLAAKGVKVVGVPLDCVIGVLAEGRGVELTPPDIDLTRLQLQGRRFDCIIFGDSLHRFADPVAILKSYRELLAPSGTIIVSAPNFNHVSILKERAYGRMNRSKVDAPGGFAQFHTHWTTSGRIQRWLRAADLKPTAWCMPPPERFARYDRLSLGKMRTLLAENLVVAARAR